jgi:hypothetical protein
MPYVDHCSHPDHPDHKLEMDHCALDFAKVDLVVHCRWETGESNGGLFAIIGPTEVVEQLGEMGVKPNASIGKLSPKAKVTVDGAAARKSAGIPLNAATFCHLLAAPALINLEDQLMALQLSRNDWAFVLLLGGFAYFDDAGVLLAVNAMTLNPPGHRHGLIMEGCKVENQETVLAIMERQGRLARTLDGWDEGGFKKICWVHPSETVEGNPVCETPYPHGGALTFSSLLILSPPTKPASPTQMQELRSQSDDVCVCAPPSPLCPPRICAGFLFEVTSDVISQNLPGTEHGSNGKDAYMCVPAKTHSYLLSVVCVVVGRQQRSSCVVN